MKDRCKGERREKGCKRTVETVMKNAAVLAETLKLPFYPTTCDISEDCHFSNAKRGRLKTYKD
jgi:hypothetical protein